MKYLALILSCLLLTSCIGSPEPHNPLKRNNVIIKSICAGGQDVGMVERLWWQRDTADEDSLAQWELFVEPNVTKDWSDPWADYQEPKLFPKGWTPAFPSYLDGKRSQLKQHGRILKMNKIIKEMKEIIKRMQNNLKSPKVEKEESLHDRYEDLKRREREYFNRSI